MEMETIARIVADGGLIAFAAWRIIRQDKLLDTLLSEMITRTSEEHEAMIKQDAKDSATGQTDWRVSDSER